MAKLVTINSFIMWGVHYINEENDGWYPDAVAALKDKINEKIPLERNQITKNLSPFRTAGLIDYQPEEDGYVHRIKLISLGRYESEDPYLVEDFVLSTTQAKGKKRGPGRPKARLFSEQVKSKGGFEQFDSWTIQQRLNLITHLSKTISEDIAIFKKGVIDDI